MKCDCCSHGLLLVPINFLEGSSFTYASPSRPKCRPVGCRPISLSATWFVAQMTGDLNIYYYSGLLSPMYHSGCVFCSSELTVRTIHL